MLSTTSSRNFLVFSSSLESGQRFTSRIALGTAVGDIIEQRNQKFRLAFFVSRDHARTGQNAPFRAALHHEFSAGFSGSRVQGVAVRGFHACGRLGTEDFIGALADDVVAGKP